MYRLLNCFIYSSLVVVATEVVKEASPPKLPDLERYWKPVQEDSTNFTGWTYLLQYVDQEVILMQLQSPYVKSISNYDYFYGFQTDAVAARDAYNAFLGHYPYCYGYWRKYADYERTKGDRNKCEEVSASQLVRHKMKFNFKYCNSATSELTHIVFHLSSPRGQCVQLCVTYVGRSKLS